MSTEATGFLYPFLEAEGNDPADLMADLARSARAKMEDSARLRADTVRRCAPEVEAAASAMAARFRAGGRLFAFGNGGSATDAEGMVELFGNGIDGGTGAGGGAEIGDRLRAGAAGGRPLPALSLVDDRAVLTALANDVGFDLVFSRQVIAYARPGDIAVGFSTSGNSANVLRALAEARRRDVLTVGFSGYEGGAMAHDEAVQHCLVVRSDSVHRIQEAQAALVLALWTAVQRWLDEGSVQ